MRFRQKSELVGNARSNLIAPSTLCRRARPLGPVLRPNARPIPGIKPVLTLHHPLLREDRSAPVIRFPLVRRPTRP